MQGQMTGLIHAVRLAGSSHAGKSLTTRETPLISEEPLGPHRSGVISMATIGLISFISTLSLLVFLTHRFIFWRRYYKRPLVENQYVVLIFNLLLADIQQATAFLLAWYWVANNKVIHHSAPCYLQGWFIQIADPGSGLFVMAIATHTAAVVLRGKQLEHRSFIYCIVGLWVFVFALGVIPLGLHGSETFVISESGWCWFSQDYQAMRIWAHYLWIFVAEFGNFVLYGLMFFHLRRRTKQADVLHKNKEQLNRLNRVVYYMVLYPFVYLVLSLPLAAGRMLTATNHIQSKTYFAVAGSIMALSGFVDVIVYTLTRRRLVLENEHQSSDRGISDPTQPNTYQTQVVSTTDSKGWKKQSRFRRKDSKLDAVVDDGGSTDNIVRKEDLEMNDMHRAVYQETTIEVTHEHINSSDEHLSDRRRSPN